MSQERGEKLEERKGKHAHRLQMEKPHQSGVVGMISRGKYAFAIFV